MLDQPATPKPRNPHTQAKIRREVFWQIILPMSLAVIFMLTVIVSLSVMTVTGTSFPARSPLANVSLIFLIIPTALWGLVLFLLIGAFVAGLFYALRELPALFKQAQDFMVLVAAYTNKYAARIIDGVYSVRSIGGSVQQTLSKIRSTFSFME